MVRKVHEEELRERQNMRDNAKHRKDGDWCVVGVLLLLGGHPSLTIALALILDFALYP